MVICSSLAARIASPLSIAAAASSNQEGAPDDMPVTRRIGRAERTNAGHQRLGALRSPQRSTELGSQIGEAEAVSKIGVQA